MFATEWLTLPISRLITLTLLHFVWQGFAVATLLLVMLEACRVRRVGARYACSLVALVMMVLAPPATLVVLIAQRGGGSELVIGGLGVVAASPPTVVSFWGYWLQRVEPAVLAVWCCGVLLFGGRLLTGAVGVARLRRNALPLPAKFVAVIEQLGLRLRMDAEGIVLLSHQVTEAMAVGLVRPLVLIPAAWVTEMPLEMLEAVIAHELAHLARRDLWVNLLQRIVETVLFYHPAVWWLSRRLRIERELCADDLAVMATGKRLEYAQALEQIAGERLADIRPALAAFLRGENDMRLLQRVRNVLDQSPEERSRLWPAGVLALLIPLGLWGAAAWNTPAVADDDRDDDNKPKIKRERAEREEVKRTAERLQSDKKEAEKRATVNRERDARFNENSNRDGKKPEVSEVREERYTIIRDGRAPEEIVEQVIVTKDGRPVTVTETGGQRDKQGDRRIDELTALVKQLSHHVERLQDEVASLRAQKQGDKAATSSTRRSTPVPAPANKREGDKREGDKREADERGQLDGLKRELKQELEKVETVKRDVEAKAKAIQQQERTIGNAEDITARIKPILDDVRIFSDKIARDPRQLGLKEQAAERVEAFNRAANEKAEAKERAAKQQAEAAAKVAEGQRKEAERARKKAEEDLSRVEEERSVKERKGEEPRAGEGGELRKKIIDARELRERERSDRERTLSEIKKLEERLQKLKERRVEPSAEQEIELDLNDEVFKKLQRDQQALLRGPEPQPKPVSRPGVGR